MLADSGIPLGCQTVLLRGITDSPAGLEAPGGLWATTKDWSESPAPLEYREEVDS